MIKKVISGGQSGAERAALDVAIKLGIPHGGSIPGDRKTDDGVLPAQDRLQGMPPAGDSASIEKNVVESDGTLIIAREKLAGRVDDSRRMTLRHHKQLLGVDLNQTHHYEAASLIASWIDMQRIEVLNVAGPRAGEDPEIYDDVFRILEQAIQILMDGEAAAGAKNGSRANQRLSKPPLTVDQAVERLISELSLKFKTTIANMAEVELGALHETIGEYIRNEFGLWSGNKDLMISCFFFAKSDKITADDASSIIIKELWKRLRESHRLRVVE
jgi:hypothetical protein